MVQYDSSPDSDAGSDGDSRRHPSQRRCGLSAFDKARHAPLIADAYPNFLMDGAAAAQGLVGWQVMVRFGQGEGNHSGANGALTAYCRQHGSTAPHPT